MLSGDDGTIETFLHHNPTNTSLHTKKDQGSFFFFCFEAGGHSRVQC